MLTFFVSWRTSLFVGLGALLLILVGLCVYSIYHNYWVIPHRHIASVTPGVLKQKEILELRNNIRQSFIQALGVLGGVIGGAVLLGGLYFTARTLRISLETLRVNQKTLETTQQRQITERFTKAIEQLGSENRAIRLGGIYALERIARDSEVDHWPVMEVLTAFVREQAPAQKQAENMPEQEKAEQARKLLEEKGFDAFREAVFDSIQEEQLRVRADIQAVLTVLGRRTRTYGKGESQRLNLQFTNLQYADLQGAQLQGAMLEGAQLQRAKMQGAQLQHALLSGAKLQRATLHHTKFEEADLKWANIEGTYLIFAELQKARLDGVRGQGAIFAHAQLQGATFEGAHLQRAGFPHAQLQGATFEGAHLQGAYLQLAENLTQERIDTACLDDDTTLPAGLKKPPPCPANP
jgi:uncharacterized protein YjbI with pentapeptide repeats